jgi:hypothetical protein
VHVATRDIVATEAAIRALVASAGFELLSLHPIAPSLEDVFVAVMSSQPAPP